MTHPKYGSKTKLACDYIQCPQTLRAVFWAVEMIRKGTYTALANGIAAKKYGVRIADVAFYTGQHAARVKESRRGKRRRWA